MSNRNSEKLLPFKAVLLVTTLLLSVLVLASANFMLSRIETLELELLDALRYKEIALLDEVNKRFACAKLHSGSQEIKRVVYKADALMVDVITQVSRQELETAQAMMKEVDDLLKSLDHDCAE